MLKIPEPQLDIPELVDCPIFLTATKVPLPDESVIDNKSLISSLIEKKINKKMKKSTLTKKKTNISTSVSSIRDVREKRNKKLASTVESNIINDFFESKDKNNSCKTSMCIKECNIQSEEYKIFQNLSSVNDKVLPKALLDDTDTSPKKKILIKENIMYLFPSLKPDRILYQQSENITIIVNNEQIINLSHLQVFFGSSTNPFWYQFFYYKVVALAITPVLLVICLEDGSVHIFYIIFGVRATPILVPPSPIARVHAKYNMAMIISCYGDILVWEVLADNYCRLIISTSIAHLVSSNLSLVTCELHNETICLKLSNSKGYIYNKNTDLWLLVNNNQDPIWQWSAKNCVNSASVYGRVAVGQLAVLQRNIALMPNLLSLKNTSYDQSAMISYFELQLSASKLINSPQEYIYWLNVFVTYLCSQDNVERRLRSLLDELLDTNNDINSKTSEHSMLGSEKYELLKEVLKIIMIHVHWQSLYFEYKLKLEDLNNICSNNLK